MRPFEVRTLPKSGNSNLHEEGEKVWAIRREKQLRQIKGEFGGNWKLFPAEKKQGLLGFVQKGGGELSASFGMTRLTRYLPSLF